MLLQLLALVILARFLSPTDYGLVAMVAAVVAFGEILRDFGLSAAAVQAPTLSREQRDNLFWINAGIGFALCLAAFALAPAVAALYGEPRIVAITQLSV